eukprot:CAMPEP_0171384320 /NCGR_PEP_ID=MMETSP0879-20121228/38409_1 /TAXON_ID=67004 /ORGANISM="Thalassiosira weissflogii, Strain CCMP1336" /LENGTH=799 /DNA_ID=CAMNT_0011896591 /DNA_START=96 /DNA_END=2495 /DNA_ORIENTATION=+
MSTATASSSSDGTVIDKTTTTSQMSDGSQQISVTTHIRKSDGTVTKKTVTRTVFTSRASSGDWSDGDLFLEGFNDVESADKLHLQHRQESHSFLEGKDVICDVPLGNLAETRTSKNRVSFATNVNIAEISEGVESKSTTTLLRNKKCQAVVIIFVLWSVTVTLLVMTLVFDWFRNDKRSCLLCEGGLDFDFIHTNFTPWPTRQPSTASIDLNNFDGLGILKPPPDNLAQICSPSILLERGPNYRGAPSADLVAICTKVCMPAVCCLANNENSKKSLLSILEMQGMGALAAPYLASMKDCYNGDNVAICDAYSAWCGTLFDLDTVLMGSVKKQMDSMCSDEPDDLILASSRSSALSNVYNQCSIACNAVECCFQNMQDHSDISNPIVDRKRKRGHDYSNMLERVRTAEGECQQYSSLPGSITYKICNAYADYCDSVDFKSNQTNATNSVSISLITRAPTTPVASSVEPSRTPAYTNPSPSSSNSSKATVSPTTVSTDESSNARSFSSGPTIDAFFDNHNSHLKYEGHCVNAVNCTEMATESACNEIGCSWSSYSCTSTEVIMCEQFNLTESCEQNLSCEWITANIDSEMINITQNETELVPSSNPSFAYIPSPSPTIPSPSIDFVSITINTSNPTVSQSFNFPSNVTVSMSNESSIGFVDFGHSSFLTPSYYPTSESSNVGSDWLSNTNKPASVQAFNSTSGTALSLPSASAFPSYTHSLAPETAGNAQNTTLVNPSFSPMFQFASFGNVSTDIFVAATSLLTPVSQPNETNITNEVPMDYENSTITELPTHNPSSIFNF